MADFKNALEKVLKNEGGYVNDPDDTGGETYKGIARNFWPNWEGWRFIDTFKKGSDFPNILDKSPQIQALIVSFYKTNFWDKVSGDSITNQEVANSIFDFAVNAGTGVSAQLTQTVVGVDADGSIGQKSIEAINGFDTELFLASFTLAKIARYIGIIQKRPVNQKYLYGWVKRALNL